MKNGLKNLYHKFVVHPNESARRKSGHVDLETVIYIYVYTFIHVIRMFKNKPLKYPQLTNKVGP